MVKVAGRSVAIEEVEEVLEVLELEEKQREHGGPYRHEMPIYAAQEPLLARLVELEVNALLVGNDLQCLIRVGGLEEFGRNDTAIANCLYERRLTRQDGGVAFYVLLGSRDACHYACEWSWRKGLLHGWKRRVFSRHA